MSAEEPQNALSGIDPELKNTLFELCMSEFDKGQITMADVPRRLEELARVHAQGAKDVAAVALNPVHSPDMPIDVPIPTVRVDLLEKEK